MSAGIFIYQVVFVSGAIEAEELSPHLKLRETACTGDSLYNASPPQGDGSPLLIQLGAKQGGQAMRIAGNSVLLLAILCVYSTHADEPADAPPIGFAVVDLQPWANVGFKGRLATLINDPKPKTLGGVPFKLESAGLRLRGERLPDDPTKIQNIAIDRTIHRLHLLHATEHGGRGHGVPGHPNYVEDGALIGQYQVQYADGLIEVIPIVYGHDVRDWWNWDRSKPTKRSKIAWEGQTPLTQRFNMTVRLYLSTWTNPRPEKKVAAITMVSTADTMASPFCLAMTIQDPPNDTETFLRNFGDADQTAPKR